MSGRVSTITYRPRFFNSGKVAKILLIIVYLTHELWYILCTFDLIISALEEKYSEKWFLIDRRRLKCEEVISVNQPDW